MTFPLVEPRGWFLYTAEHQHNAIIYPGDEYHPLLHADGPWLVRFQKYTDRESLIEARGHSLGSAWEKAVSKVANKNAQEFDPLGR